MQFAGILLGVVITIGIGLGQPTPRGGTTEGGFGLPVDGVVKAKLKGSRKVEGDASENSQARK